MDNLYPQATIDLINDTAIVAFNDAQDAGLADYQGKAEFLSVAGLAFDRAARFADPNARRPEFLG